MSNLSDNIAAHKTHNVYAQYKPIEFLKIEDKVRTKVTPDYLDEYEIKCTLGTYVKFSPLDSETTKNYIIQAAKRSILESIFGEFRQDLYRARLALHNHDLDRVEQHLQKIETAMFDY
jgi:hypothetical protein